MSAAANADLITSSSARDADSSRDLLSRRKNAASAITVKAPRLGSNNTNSPMASLARSSRSTGI